MSLQFYTDNIRGSDLTGANNTTGRTYTLDNPSQQGTTQIIDIIVNNASLNAPDYTHNATNDVITFNNVINDAMYIKITYFANTSPLPTSTYCSRDDVRRQLQLGYTFDGSSIPTADDVDEFIFEAQDGIDAETNHAWRETTVSNEYYDWPSPPAYRRGAGIAIYMKHRKIRDLSSVDGDKIEIWNGQEYVDWLSTKTEGRGADFWIDLNQGVLYIYQWHTYYLERPIRLTYRYGETTVPRDIQKCCTKMVAIELVQSDDRSQILNETGDVGKVTQQSRVDQWQKDVDKILDRRREFWSVQ